MPSPFCGSVCRSISPYINRFIQPDTIILGMGSTQSWNRYSYVLNNPINGSDPSGYYCVGDMEGCASELGQGPATSSSNHTAGTGGGGGKDKCKKSDPDCGSGSGRGEGGTGPVCYPGELRCQLGKDGYKQSDSWRNIQPDYWVVSGIIPLCPAAVPICGIALSLYVDRYKNVYLAGGFGIGLPVTVSAGGGWFLGSDNNNEAFAEKFLQGHSVTVSGGAGPGIGVNNNYPSYIQTHNEGSSKENIAIEALITSPGVDATGTFGVLFYDHGDETPWLWQGD